MRAVAERFSLRPTALRRFLPLAAFAASVLLAAPQAARGQTTAPPDLRPVGTNRPSVDVGGSLTLQVRFTIGEQPVAQYPIDFTVVSSPGGVSGPANPRFTNVDGVASATFSFDEAGSVRIDANALDSSAGSVSFNITVREAGGGGGGTPAAPRVGALERIGPGEIALVLGDRNLFEVRVLDTQGNPLPGIALTWTVEESPGSPRSVGATTPSDAAGIATGDFGFSVTGHTEISASYPGVSPVRWQIDTASLGTLTPDNRSYGSTGAALDAICAEVFASETPEPTPLCVYMTGALTTRDSRAQAVAELTATGIGSQTTAAAAGLADQMKTVEARLSALRGGALRQALTQISLNVGGGVVTDGLLASARSAHERQEAFETRIDQSLRSFGAGKGRQSGTTPAAGSAPSPKRDRPWGFFVNARLTEGDRPAGQDETGFDFDTFGATVGIDRAVGANRFFGAALSLLETETDLADNAGTLDVSGTTLTLYGIWEGRKSGYFQATAAYGVNEYEQARVLELPAIGTLTARGDFDGTQLAGTLEAGWSWDGWAGTTTLFGRGSFARAEVDGFRESGATAVIPGFEFLGESDFGIEVDDQEIDSLVGEIGIDFARVYQFSGGLFVPQLNLSALHEFDDDGQRIRGRFLGDVAAGSAFELYTDDPDRDYFNVGASIRFQFLWGSFFVAYDQELERDDLDLATWNGGLRFEF